MELGSDVRSVSPSGSRGDLGGRELCDICDGEREEGKEDSEVRRGGSEALEWLLLRP